MDDIYVISEHLNSQEEPFKGSEEKLEPGMNDDPESTIDIDDNNRSITIEKEPYVLFFVY
ncbi:hypothetical protein I4U23_017020 [Adineta vaga]|nr:hypothetical protein I4U23_017020 [Adineta vaga]